MSIVTYSWVIGTDLEKAVARARQLGQHVAFTENHGPRLQAYEPNLDPNGRYNPTAVNRYVEKHSRNGKHVVFVTIVQQPQFIDLLVAGWNRNPTKRLQSVETIMSALTKRLERTRTMFRARVITVLHDKGELVIKNKPLELTETPKQQAVA